MKNFLREDFVDLIQSYLLYQKPLSVIRYGDGETMMLSNDRDKYSFILKKVLGYVPSDQEIQLIRQYLVKAYKECDVLGIPTERHLAREDNWKQSLDVFKKEVGENILLSKTHTSIDIFYDLLSMGSYDELLKNRQVLNYISCRNLDEVFKSRFNIKEVNSFIISPEPTYTSGYKGEKHFPEQFNKIEKWIKNLNCTGQLCLVGAGIPGKIYNNWFRDQGGVSLDIGSIFDAWAGKKTRGKGRGLDVEDLTNKL